MKAPGAGYASCMTNDNASEAREGLLDGVTGKVKEVAGAVSGNDDLVQEGQLQQEESRHRKAAVADQAIAEAKQEEAAEELQDTTREVDQQRDAVHARAAQEESLVDQQRGSEHSAAEQEAARLEAARADAAEQHADRVAETRLQEAESLREDADRTEEQAAAEQARLEREAAEAEQQAQRLRAETEK